MTGVGQPGLSIVLAANNAADSDAADLTSTVGSWCKAAHKHGAAIEFMVVDWNTPQNRPPLRRALKSLLPADAIVRILDVPQALHVAFPQSADVAIVEHLAWNAAIRRANGAFILVTRPGVVPTDELADFVLAGNLDSSLLYRTDVYEGFMDVNSMKPLANKIGQRIHRSRETIDLERSTVDYRFRRSFDVWGEPPLKMVAQILTHAFLLLRESWQAVRRGQNKPFRALSYLGAVWLSDFRQASYLFNVRHKAWLFFRPLHVNATGDFLLVARDRWLALRGVPEYSGHPYLVDALFVIAAVSARHLRQKALSWPMAVMRSSRLETAPPQKISLPVLTPFDAAKEADILAKSSMDGRSFNSDNWGLGDLELMEWVLGSKSAAM